MIILLRTLAGLIIGIGGIAAGLLALFKWGAFLGLCVLLVFEGIASILMPDIDD